MARTEADHVMDGSYLHILLASLLVVENLFAEIPEQCQ